MPEDKLRTGDLDLHRDDVLIVEDIIDSASLSEMLNAIVAIASLDCLRQPVEVRYRLPASRG